MPLFMDVHHSRVGSASTTSPRRTRQTWQAGRPRRAVPALLGRRGRGRDLLPGRRSRRGGRNTVHREAHGLVADEIYPVQEGV